MWALKLTEGQNGSVSEKLFKSRPARLRRKLRSKMKRVKIN